MNQQSEQLYLLSGQLPDEALARLPGGLELIPTDPAEPSTYAILDSYDGALRKAGTPLIEADGVLRLIAEDGLIARADGALSGGFTGDLDKGALKSALSRLSSLRSLQPLGTGQLDLRHAALCDDEGKTHVRLRIEELSHDGSGHGLTLITARALRGYDKSLRRFETRLSEILQNPGAAPQDLFARLVPNAPAPGGKVHVALKKKQRAAAAANAIIAQHLPASRATEAGVIADLDTEYLHDYRVNLRKIRSVLSLFRGVYSEAQTEMLKAEFSDLMAQTGTLRDLDVYLLEKQDYFDLLPKELHDGLRDMFAVFEDERKAAHKALSKHLKSARYARRVERLDALFNSKTGPEPGPHAGDAAYDLARALIWKRYRKVCAIARNIDAQTDDEEVHELRIQCKKLRYLMEFFGPFFPVETFKPLLKPLKKLQDNLGYFNDYSVQQDSLRVFLETHTDLEKRKLKRLRKSVHALIDVLHDKQVQERARVEKNFAHFHSPQTRQSFRDLFKTKGA